MTIKDVVFQESQIFRDQRGIFRKSFASTQLETFVDFRLSEVFHSISKAGVFRGLHLQTKDSASFRSISLVNGHVIDILLDLRRDSESFLQSFYFDWKSDGEISSILLPPGVAHGFLALEEATLVYASNRSHNPKTDTGVNPFSLDLPMLNDIREISDRDLKLPDISSWANGEISV